MTSSTLHQDTMIRWRQRAPWFSVLWLFYLAYPIDQLFFSPQMTALQRWEGTMGSLVFIVVYLAFYFRNRLPSMRVILLTAMAMANSTRRTCPPESRSIRRR